jgi:uncharacterized Fe-S cluster-containing radical SAM superfamily enzyme
MKVKVHLKTPDVVEDTVKRELEYLKAAGVPEDVREDMGLEIRDCLEKFFKYGECVTLEVCTDGRRAEVLNAR